MQLTLTLSQQQSTDDTLRERALSLVSSSDDPEGLSPEQVALILNADEKETRNVLWWLWCDRLVTRSLFRYLPNSQSGAKGSLA